MKLRGYAACVAAAVFPLLTVAAMESIESVTSAAGPSQQAEGPRSVWTGVFTEDQANRGRPIYLVECAGCHSESLAGGESSPPLTGDTFLDAWNGKTVGDLFERTRSSMPQDSPGRLSGKEYARLLAYIFKVNSFPAGGTELDADLATLKLIRIDKDKPLQGG